MFRNVEASYQLSEAVSSRMPSVGDFFFALVYIFFTYKCFPQHQSVKREEEEEEEKEEEEEEERKEKEKKE